MFVNVLFMFDEFVLHHLLKICSLSTQMRQAINHILDQMKTVQVILHPHIKSCCNRTLFFIATDMQVAIGPAIGQSMD